MLEYNEVKERKYIVFDDEPYEVLTSHVFRKQQRKPVNATELRNLISGRVVEHSFQVSDKVEEAEIAKKPVKFIYQSKGEYWFCDIKNPADRFKLTPEQIGDVQIKFLKPNLEIDLLMFGDPNAEGGTGKGTVIGVKLPIKVELKVTEAADAVKGNTVSGGSKAVTLETGAEIYVPMFINQGDVLRINTETGEYVERVGK
ncbi:MAG: hypothetical protein A2928_00025 [Candidatus Taylorbacteria bacterium RIFCSPLOWO2_01_FULL_45_15b]|uniref:Elongation factor P C-terminal domain-containing protein n=1 Tax=Candidatus Taylorbacteria bacterium RIFCSPLOWO2_01_FULL_45_15b TaxID=1802319 RepID=A0A1G2NCP6_9BACT|nr:MAG: hypothetical protein A2928_00025 [Candidatus Taylorbacteria bacterium RIFCSPLOWO2_01_FULL_45_15b]